MYFADYHTHSTCSDDGHNTMTEMAAAALSAGLNEICLTDHLDVVTWLGEQVCEHSWRVVAEQFAAARTALGSRIKIQLGVELGQATEDFSRRTAFWMTRPPLTLSSHRFIICLGNTGAGIFAPSKRQTKLLHAVPSADISMKCWLWPGGAVSVCWAI